MRTHSLSTPFDLAADEVHVWIGNARSTHQHHCAIGQFTSALDAMERERAARRKSADDRSSFIGTRVMQRLVLSWYATGVEPRDLRFETGAHGRPRLAAEFASLGLHFNIAHTEGMIAMAVARESVVGVDVEKILARSSMLRIAARYFSAGEAASLAALPPEDQPRRFFTLWTLKEAWLKATGEGLGAGLHNASFALSAQLPFGTIDITAGHIAGDHASRWRFWLVHSRDHMLSVAVRTESRGANYRLSLLNFPCRSGQEQGAEP